MSRPAHSSRLQQIDVLRGLAALTVVFSHYIPYWNRYNTAIPVVVPNEAGFLAVELFFVISGFVIFMTLEKCTTVADFAVMRFSRLYPAYWASLLGVAMIGSLLFGQQPWLPGLLVNMTMLQEFVGYPNMDVVYWSLTVELAFYFNAAWLFALGWHRYPGRVVLVWLFASAVWGATRDLGAQEAHALLARLFALEYAAFFSLGIVLFDAERRGWTWRRGALIGLAIVTEFIVGSWTGLACAAFFGLAVALAAADKARWSVCRLTLWLGAISYSLYLVHRNIGYWLLSQMHEWGLGAVTSIATAAAIALLLATVLTQFVEHPALRFFRSWWQRRHPR